MRHRELVGGLHPEIDRTGGEQPLGIEIRGDEGLGEGVTGSFEVLALLSATLLAEAGEAVRPRPGVIGEMGDSVAMAC